MSRMLYEVCQKCQGQGRIEVEGAERPMGCSDCNGRRFRSVGVTMKRVQHLERESVEFNQLRTGLALLKNFFLGLPADDKAVDSLLGDVADERGIR